MLGAHLLPDGRCEFSVWAPNAKRLSLELHARETGAVRTIPLLLEGEIHRARVEGAGEGDRYFFVFPDGRKRPDPRSLRQPEGVHGPSEVVDLGRMRDILRARPGTKRKSLVDWVIYELHVGTFTPMGTFDGVIGKLPYLAEELGISAIELMPICPFPGTRNWGYDGVAPFAVQESYGGPEGLARLVAAAHEHGIAMILDMVYNHLGPEGNYLREFGPYFTDRYETPWGEAVNYDGKGSEQVRSWAVENAVHWVRNYGFDALRLDAVQAIYDESATHVLQDMGAAVQEAGGLVIAESDLNDPVTVLPRPEGWGLDAQWSDDLHHALHAILSKERVGCFVDFGRASDVALALSQGFAYDGSRYSTFRQQWLGKSSEPMEAEHHVVCMQNHDQIGNRARGERFPEVAGLEAAKVGASVVLLSAGTPLLFMGEEYAASQPFTFFTSHGDPQVIRGVRKGRRFEFSAFDWKGEIPDPQRQETFDRAILHLEERREPCHREILALYRLLLRLRSEHPALGGTHRKQRLRAEAFGDEEGLLLERWSPDGKSHLALLASFSKEGQEAHVPLSQGVWRRLLDTADPDFAGPGCRGPRSLHVEEGGCSLSLPPLCAWVYERDQSLTLPVG